MTDTEKAEVIDTFISIGEKFLKCSKHFHLESILTRDTIQAIKELEKENAELKAQIKGFENDFDYQNKVIEKYKEDLKKLRVAYIQAQVANAISGTDFETILKNVLNGSLKNEGL